MSAKLWPFGSEADELKTHKKSLDAPPWSVDPAAIIGLPLFHIIEIRFMQLWATCSLDQI